MKSFLAFTLLLISLSCTSNRSYMKSVSYIDMNQFMTKWYVVAGRLTIFEKGAHNAIENYSWNAEKEQIEIDFTFKKDSFEGKSKSIAQKGWIKNKKSNAHWIVSPFWPLKFDYLVIDIADDYSWTVIGVPSQKWVWIMSKNWKMEDELINKIIKRVAESGYSVDAIKRVPQSW